MSSQNWLSDSTSRILLAPMEGIVDPLLREALTRIGGIDLCTTEFIRITNQLLPEKVFTHYCPELKNKSCTSSGTPVAIQLLGSDLQCMAENAARASELGAFSIDINFGCPARSVNSHDGGASLLKTPERITKIISAVRTATPSTIAVSAKIRLGYENKDRFLEIAQAAEDGGASWLTVHARTKLEGYKPPAHWEYIGRIKAQLKIPVVANGEIWSLEDFQRCQEHSHCQHVMIGRGAIANPGLALQIQSFLNNNKIPSFHWLHWQNFVLGYLKKCETQRNTAVALARSKQLLKIMGQNYGEANWLFEQIKRLSSFDEVASVLEQNFIPPPLSTAPLQVQRFLPKNF